MILWAPLVSSVCRTILFTMLQLHVPSLITVSSWVLGHCARKRETVMFRVNPCWSGPVWKCWELASCWAALCLAAAELSCILFSSSHCSVDQSLVLFLLEPKEGLWCIFEHLCQSYFVFNRLIFQISKVADEMGGVSHPEYCANQHAESFMVSSYFIFPYLQLQLDVGDRAAQKIFLILLFRMIWLGSQRLKPSEFRFLWPEIRNYVWQYQYIAWYHHNNHSN